jgi:hypothetical protein
MTIVGYPSSDFPPPPTFTLRIPDNWRAAWPAGTLLAVHGPEGPGGVRPSVLVAHQRLPPKTGLDDVVASLIEELRQTTPAPELEPPRRLEVEHAIAAALLWGSFATDAGVRVEQRQTLLQVASAGDATVLLQITATCETGDLETVQAVEASFAFAPAGAESLLPPAAG